MPCKHTWRCAGLVIRKSQFDSGTGLHPGKAQRGLSTRSIIERPLVRPQLPGPGFCGQVNRCHAGLISHASGVQLASPQPFLGESFNGRTAGLQPANEGSIPSSSTSSPGRPLWSRRRSEKPDKYVRFVLLAPTLERAQRTRTACALKM